MQDQFADHMQVNIQVSTALRTVGPPTTTTSLATPSQKRSPDILYKARADGKLEADDSFINYCWQD